MRFVAVRPGAITLTRTPKGANSNANELENPIMPALAPAYAVRPALPVNPISEEVLSILSKSAMIWPNASRT
jgi:hypothetical protein